AHVVECHFDDVLIDEGLHFSRRLWHMAAVAERRSATFAQGRHLAEDELRQVELSEQQALTACDGDGGDRARQAQERDAHRGLWKERLGMRALEECKQGVGEGDVLRIETLERVLAGLENVLAHGCEVDSIRAREVTNLESLLPDDGLGPGRSRERGF